MTTAIDFASFDISELDVLDASDAVALPEMGASIVIIFETPDGEELIGESDLNGKSGSLSTSCC